MAHNVFDNLISLITVQVRLGKIVW